MARALMGHVGTSNEHVLAYEITRLRRRVAELETQLAEMRLQHSEILDTEGLDTENLHPVDLDLRDLELHRLTGSAQPVPA